jgi:hypothetical protein
LDISFIKELRYGGFKCLALIVEDYTYYSWSIFLKSKSDLNNKMFNLLNDLKMAEIDVKFICCDNSMENKSFYDSSKWTQHQV